MEQTKAVQAFLSPGSGICTRTVAANITAHPSSSRELICSPSKTDPAMTANTDSRLISSDAMVGSVNFWATICRVYPIPPETTPQYKMGTAAATMPAQFGFSVKDAITAETTAAVANWMAASSTALASFTKEYRPGSG